MMKRIIVILIAVMALGAAQADRNSSYEFYYLDNARNVCSVEIGTQSKSVTHPNRLTSRGGYDDYSVSPNGSQVLAWRQIGIKHDSFPVFKFFLEKRGKLQGQIMRNLMADSNPSAHWSPQSKYLIVSVPQQVEMETIIYSLDRRKTVCETTDLLPDLCDDQAFSFVLEDKGDEDNSPSWLSVLDMRTAKKIKLAQVNFGAYGDPSQNVWFGKTHKFAYIDIKGNVSAGEVIHSKSKPVVKKWMLTSSGNCSDLRYISNKGIYFVQKTGAIRNAYYSKDLRSLKKTAVLPIIKDKIPTDTQSQSGRVYSPDNLLYATVEIEKPGKLGMIRVYDKVGHVVDVARGNRPKWKASKHD